MDDSNSNNNNSRSTESTKEQEEWTLAFSHVQHDDASAPTTTMAAVRATEESLRDLLLRVQSLGDTPRVGGLRITDATSFRLVWHLMPPPPSTEEKDPTAYGALYQGVQEGRWMSEAPQSRDANSGRVRRPLHHVKAALVNVQFYYSQVSSTTTAKRPPEQQRRVVPVARHEVARNEERKEPV
jgi:hypothetical protein